MHACRALAAATALTPESMQAARDSADRAKRAAGGPAINRSDETVQMAEIPKEHLYETAAASSSGVATAMADAATGPLAVPRAALAPDLLLDGSRRTPLATAAPRSDLGIVVAIISRCQVCAMASFCFLATLLLQR